MTARELTWTRTPLLRLRGRLALWAVRPFLAAVRNRAWTAYENGVKPTSYHEDWWAGQFFGLAHLERDLRFGYVSDPDEFAAAQEVAPG